MSRSVVYTASPLLASKTPVWRSKFIVAMIALGFVGLGARAAYVQVFGNAFFQRQGEVRFARTLELPANRGKILDRNGLILASSVPAASIWAIPEDVDQDKPEVRAKLKQRQTWFDVSGGLITGFDYNLWASTSVGGFAMTKAEFVATLKYTLDQRLAGNRSPFLFGAHTDYYVAAWNQNATGTPSENDRRAAIEEFLDYAKAKQEVEITSYKRVLEYVRNPTVRP